MSEVNKLVIAGSEFPLEIVEFTKKTRTQDPATKKNKVVESKYPVILPAFKTVAAAASLFTALATLAEEREAGQGLKFAQHLLFEQLEDACDESFNKDTGNLDVEKWLARASATARARSAGQSLDSIYQELAELGLEFVSLQRAGATADGWKSVTDKSGAPRFGSIHEYGLRMNEVMNKMDNLSTVSEQRAADLEKRRADREAKAAQAKAAAAAAAQATLVEA
jgi:hypothetical protein